jgi:hypothetical protein
MNYQINAVAPTTDGFGFSILDSGGRLLVTISFQHEDKAKEAHRRIGEIISIATNITPHT